MDAIGPNATAANVLLTRLGEFPGNPPGTHEGVSFGGLGLNLAAGTYFLVISSGAGPGTGWGSGADEIPSLIGSVGPAFVGIATSGAIGTYNDLDPNNPNDSHANFRIDDLRAIVPEPGSLVLLATFAIPASIGAMRRRSRRSDPA